MNNPLLSRLASLRRRVRLLEGWQGLCALVIVAVGAALVAGLLDWWVIWLPSLVRAVLLVGIVTGTALVAYRYLYLPFRAPCDDLTLALRIEEEFPDLNDALGSTVQFLTLPADTPGAASSSVAMREKAVQQTVARSQQYDFGRILSYQNAGLLSLAALVLAGIAGYLAWRQPEYTGIAVRRLVDPFGGHTWTTVDVPDAPTRLAVKQPFTVRATFGGIIPERAKVEVWDAQESPKPNEWDIKVEHGVIAKPVDMTARRGEFKFRVVALDGSYPKKAGRWHTVQVLPPPELAPLDGLPSPQVAVFPPAYTEEPSPQKLAPGSKVIKAWAGSAVVLRAATDRPVTKVWLDYRPTNVKREIETSALQIAALIGHCASAGPLADLGQMFGTRTLWDRVDADIDAGGTQFTIRLTAWVPGVCTLHLEDENGLPSNYDLTLDVAIDPLPAVELVRPATDLSVVPDAEVTFKFRARDEVFALKSVFVDYRAKGEDGQATSAPGRVVLYTGPVYEQALPHLMARLVPSASPYTPGLKLRAKQVEIGSVWHLRNQFKVGDVIEVEVGADDYCDVYGSRQPGRSHAVKLHVVSKGELEKVVGQKLKQVHEEIKQVQKEQKQSRDLVKEVQAKDKITEKDLERLEEAERLQKQIQEKVGDPEKGLRQELDKLQQMLKDNKMKDSEAQTTAGMIDGALDQLARQELKQIRQALSEAMQKATEQPPKAGDPKENKGKEPKQSQGKEQNKKDEALAKTTKLQDSALNSLNELSQALNPWASMQQVKEEVASIRDQQEQIKKALQDLKKDKDKLDQSGDNKFEKQEKENKLRDELGKNADALDSLAKRAEGMKKLIDDVQKQRQKEGDKDNTNRLKDAGKIADKAALPNKMRKSAEELKETANSARKDPTPSNQSIQQQQRNIDNLDQMLKALEGKEKDETVEKLKKHNKAQNEVEKLTKRLKELEKQVEEANNIKDDKERLAKQQELAKEFDKLKAKAEEQARELARLQDKDASKKLDDVAAELGQAADKLNKGQNPGEEQQAAEQKLQDAGKAIEQAEEELAREQLAKIADRLKGFKERQDAAIDRSKEFHQKLLAKKTWTDPLGKSLEADAAAQEGLAKEVRSLKEKIKEAKVFEHILERSAKSMDEAAEIMKERKKAGIQDRQYDLKAGQSMAKEEIDDENDKNQDTLKQQIQAAQRLQRLIDAIKEELAKKPPEKKDNDQANDQQPDQQPNLRSGDGIPPVAQLKALRSEQLDLNERTNDFARRHPNVENLTAEQRRELEQLEQDQRNLQELFRQMTASADKKGDAP
jgi:hypothetical protein